MAPMAAAGIVLLATVGLSSAVYPFGVLYPFDIQSLLICHVENPLAGGENQPDFIPETIPRLPFEQIVMQGDHPNVIWLPGRSGFRVPPGFPTPSRLIDFLGSDFNSILTSIARPAGQAPRGCELIPAAEGSAGDGKIHVSVDKDPTPLLDLVPVDDMPPFFGFGSVNREPGRTVDDPSLTDSNVATFGRIMLADINEEPELCDIHTGLCPLNTTWAELPDTFFPKFFAQGTCSNKNCSFPRGKFCEEDFTYVAYVTVLRWDCCFDGLGGQIQWACGWRKVQVPIVCDCQCACSEVFP